MKGQLFQTSMWNVFESRSTRVLLIGVAVAVKASSEVRIQLLVYMLVVMTVVVLMKCSRCSRSMCRSEYNMLVSKKL